MGNSALCWFMTLQAPCHFYKLFSALWNLVFPRIRVCVWLACFTLLGSVTCVYCSDELDWLADNRLN